MSLYKKYRGVDDDSTNQVNSNQDNSVKSVPSEFWLKTKIKGVEFDLEQLIASNRNKRNDRSIAVLRFVLEDYNRLLREIK